MEEKNKNDLLWDTLLQYLPGYTVHEVTKIKSQANVVIQSLFVESNGTSTKEQKDHDETALPLTTNTVAVELNFDGRKHLQVLETSFLTEFAWPLAAFLYLLCKYDKSKRVIVGLSGPAGSGKSTTAILLTKIINKLHDMENAQNQRDTEMVGDPNLKKIEPSEKARFGHGRKNRADDICVAISMDGYHHTNTYLENHAITDKNTEVSLRTIKGRPETFDCVKLAEDIKRLRSCCEDVAVPIYDRQLHDPVPRGQVVKLNHRLVIMEGLFVGSIEPTSLPAPLSKSWDIINSSLNLNIFLQIPQTLMEKRLFHRKVAQSGQLDTQEHIKISKKHIKTVDAVTYKELDKSARRLVDLFFCFNIHHEASSSSLTGCLESFSTQENIPNKASLKITEFFQSRKVSFNSAITPDRMTQSPQKKTLVVVGPNPALQQTWEFKTPVVPGDVNRAEKISHSIGGKGQQLAHACVHIQPLLPIHVLLYQFLGGSAGSRLEEMLAKHHDVITQRSVYTASSTRTCHTLLNGNGEATELIEPSGRVTSHERNLLLDKIKKELLLNPGSLAVVLAGTFPPGITGKFYAEVAECAGQITLLDGYRGIDEVLATNRIYILKINRTELQKIIASNDEIEFQANSQTCPSADQIQRIFARYGLKWLAVTAGADNAVLYADDGCQWEYILPPVPKGSILNPIGAGDTVTAIFISAYLHNIPIQEAFAIALAGGTASCMKIRGSTFEVDAIQQLLEGMIVRKVFIPPPT